MPRRDQEIEQLIKLREIIEESIKETTRPPQATASPRPAPLSRSTPTPRPLPREMRR